MWCLHPCAVPACPSHHPCCAPTSCTADPGIRAGHGDSSAWLPGTAAEHVALRFRLGISPLTPELCPGHVAAPSWCPCLHSGLGQTHCVTDPSLAPTCAGPSARRSSQQPCKADVVLLSYGWEIALGGAKGSPRWPDSVCRSRHLNPGSVFLISAGPLTTAGAVSVKLPKACAPSQHLTLYSLRARSSALHWPC